MKLNNSATLITFFRKMGKMKTSIALYYREMIAPQDLSSPTSVKKIQPLTRGCFIAGIGIAAALAIQKIFQSFFSLFGILIFLGKNEKYLNHFSKNGKQLFVYLGAIPIGCIGFIIPKTINTNFLEI